MTSLKLSRHIALIILFPKYFAVYNFFFFFYSHFHYLRVDIVSIGNRQEFTAKKKMNKTIALYPQNAINVRVFKTRVRYFSLLQYHRTRVTDSPLETRRAAEVDKTILIKRSERILFQLRIH